MLPKPVVSGVWAKLAPTGASTLRPLRLRLAVFFLLLFLLLTLLCVLEEVFFLLLTPLVGTAWDRLGEKVRAKVITALQIIRFAIQNLLGYGLFPEGGSDSWHARPGQLAGPSAFILTKSPVGSRVWGSLMQSGTDVNPFFTHLTSQQLLSL
jgi:hypothetical protein